MTRRHTEGQTSASLLLWRRLQRGELIARGTVLIQIRQHTGSTHQAFVLSLLEANRGNPVFAEKALWRGKESVFFTPAMVDLIVGRLKGGADAVENSDEEALRKSGYLYSQEVISTLHISSNTFTSLIGKVSPDSGDGISLNGHTLYSPAFIRKIALRLKEELSLETPLRIHQKTSLTAAKRYLNESEEK